MWTSYFGGKKWKKRRTQPLHLKYALTIAEGAEYFGIGDKKLRTILDEHEELAIKNGNKRVIKRKAMEHYLDQSVEI